MDDQHSPVELEAAVRLLIESTGQSADDDGLRDTPARVVKALREMTGGYSEDPAAILSKVFAVQHDEMIVLRGIAFTSLCEHHMLPFTGRATVGYVPGKVVGISKLARLVGCFARRLQVQERMTEQIANAVHEHLEAVGVGVVVVASHGCMACRGVRQADAEMVTSVLRGVFKTDAQARSEFLSLAHNSR